MLKKIALGTVAVFAAWEILDFIIHNLILMNIYEATPELWRPQAEMKMGLMIIVTLLSAFFFVYLYARFVGEKSIVRGFYYGLVFGLATGISKGYGTYSVMPISYSLALGWFLGSVVEASVAGLLVGWLVKES